MMKKQTLISAALFFLISAYSFSAVPEKAAVPAPAPAQTVTTAQDAGYLTNEYKNIQYPKAVESTNILSTLVSLIISLLIIILLIYIVMKAVKYFYVKASIPHRSENVVTVLAKEYLDNKSILYVIEFAGKIILVGAASGAALSAITEITDPEAITKVREQSDEYLAKYRLKADSKFDEELKSNYLKQGKKLVDSGNQVVKDIMGKFKKKDNK
jgi:flagellar biogenesis protein FliO